ncbi:MAG: hypothetical protein ACR2JW_02025 [Thermomicrobiales bacterium]
MKRRVQTIAGLTIVLLLVACGGNGGGSGNADKTATARTTDANDAATVTAFAGSRTSGAGTTAGTTPGTASGAGTRVAGNSGGFKFATLAPGGAAGSGQAAVGTPRGTVASAGSSGATPAAGRTTGSASVGTSGTPPGVSGNKYTDPQGRFTLTIPQGWRVQNASGTTIDFEATPNALKGAFQIAAEDVGAMTIDDYATGTMDGIKQTITNYQDVQGGIQQLTVGGQPARRFDFTGQDGTTNLRAAVIVVKQGTTAYGILIAADPADFDAVFAQAKQFIDSFAFLS